RPVTRRCARVHRTLPGERSSASLSDHTQGPHRTIEVARLARPRIETNEATLTTPRHRPRTGHHRRSFVDAQPAGAPNPQILLRRGGRTYPRKQNSPRSNLGHIDLVE